MPVIDRPMTPTHHLAGAAFTSLATPRRGGARTSVWSVRLSPGHPPVPHQLTRGETFIALEGNAVIHLDGVRHDARAGQVIIVPELTPFSIEAVEGDFEALCILPDGGQAFLDGSEPFIPPWAR